MNEMQLCEEVQSLAKKLVEVAVRNKALVSFAESCTGGLIGACVTDVPGASAVFPGSAVTYCNQAKHNILGVDENVLATVGAVSGECAVQMALGSRRIYGSDLAVSVTGIAGPDGGTDEKPVGTVWFGFAAVSGNGSFIRHFSGSRREVREATVKEALQFALEKLS
jgi:PncC family amidohydrolase